MRWLLGLTVCIGLVSLLLFRAPDRDIQDRDFVFPLENVLSTTRPVRITVLGTSLSHRETWPDALSALLEVCLGEAVNIEVIAQPGANVVWGREQAERVVDTLPDLVLIEFATNDADILDGVSLRKSRQLHSDLIEAMREGEPEPAVILLTMNPVSGLRGAVRPRLRAHNDQYRALSEIYDTGFIDLAPRWRALANRDWSEDGLHPEKTVAAEIIAPTVAAYIVRSAGQGVLPSC